MAATAAVRRVPVTVIVAQNQCARNIECQSHRSDYEHK